MTTIAILGAGVGGLHAALKLSDLLGRKSKKYRILLIDKRPYHIIHSSLYHAVTDRGHSETICLPLSTILAGHNIDFIQDTVHSIDPAKQTIELIKQGKINYDYLIVALGSIPNDYGVEGLGDHAFPFITFDDAIRLRRALSAEIRKNNKPRVVIGGGGLAGVELASTLAIAPNLKGKIQIDLLEQASHVLGGFPRRLSRGVEKWLKKHHVDLYVCHGIKKVKTHEIALDNGRSVPYDILVWTGGVQANPIVRKAGFEVDNCGRAIVQSTLQARGYARVYIVGDTSGFAVDNKPVPQTNPHAIKQGILAAKNLAKQLHEKAPQSYKPKRSAVLITLGHKTGYYVFGSLVIRSRFVNNLRHLYELWYLSGIMPWKSAVVAEKRLDSQNEAA